MFLQQEKPAQGKACTFGLRPVPGADAEYF